MAKTKSEKGIKQYVSTVGRRREAVARVRLYSGSKVQIKDLELKKGDIVVNDKPINEYFRFFTFAPAYNKLLLETGASGKYIFTIKVAGGGHRGQVEAVALGIARALDKLDPEKYHQVLRTNGYLTRDPRIRERRKVGMGGKARRKKQSPKR